MLETSFAFCSSESSGAARGLGGADVLLFSASSSCSSSFKSGRSGSSGNPSEDSSPSRLDTRRRSLTLFSGDELGCSSSSSEEVSTLATFRLPLLWKDLGCSSSSSEDSTRATLRLIFFDKGWFSSSSSDSATDFDAAPETIDMSKVYRQMQNVCKECKY